MGFASRTDQTVVSRVLPCTSTTHYVCMASHGQAVPLQKIPSGDPTATCTHTIYSVFVPMHDTIARYCLHNLCAPCVNHRTTKPWRAGTAMLKVKMPYSVHYFLSMSINKLPRMYSFTLRGLIGGCQSHSACQMIWLLDIPVLDVFQIIYYTRGVLRMYAVCTPYSTPRHPAEILGGRGF